MISLVGRVAVLGMGPGAMQLGKRNATMVRSWMEGRPRQGQERQDQGCP